VRFAAPNSGLLHRLNDSARICSLTRSLIVNVLVKVVSMLLVWSTRAKKVEKLSPDMQEQVLRFVTSLSVSALTGENGAALRQFSSSLDSLSARQMIQAIDEECERVDATDW
jgi:hypothetical protein